MSRLRRALATVGATLVNADTARVVIKDASGKVLADTAKRTVSSGGMVVKTA